MTSRMAPPADQFSGFFFHESNIPRPRTSEPVIETPEPGQSLPPVSEDAKRAYRIIYLKDFSTAALTPRPQPPRQQQQQQNGSAIPANNRQPQALPAAPPVQPRLLAPPPQQQQPTTLPPQHHQHQQNVAPRQVQTYQAPPIANNPMPSLQAPVPAPAAAPPSVQPPPQGPVCSHGVAYTLCSHRADHLQHVIGQLADYADKFAEAEDPDEMAQLKQQCKELRELRKLIEEAPPLQQQQQHQGPGSASSSLLRQYSGAAGGPPQPQQLPPSNLGYAQNYQNGNGYPPPHPLQHRQQQQQHQAQYNQPGTGGAYQQQQQQQQPPLNYGNNNGPTCPPGNNPYNNNNNSAYQPLPLQAPPPLGGAAGGAAACPSFGAGMYSNNGPAPMYVDTYGNNGPPQQQYQQQQFEEYIQYEPNREAMAALNTNCIDASVDPKWRQENFEWSHAMKQKNTDQFGNTKFRHTQLGVLNATMAGKDVFVLMPTGGGKSLCYQLPAVLSHGVTLVISPLTSLIQDQVAHLEILGIPSVSMTGATSDVKYGIKRGDYKVVFLTPERLFQDVSGQTMRMLESMYQNSMLARVVVDEAHCVSNWGHDFRPHYTRLSVFKDKFPTVPILALTATATPRVQRDVTLQLGLESCLLFRSSFNRPKLYLEVRDKKSDKDTLNEIAALISDKFSVSIGRQRNPKCGIIYCTTTQQCEEVADHLEAMMVDKLGRLANPNKRRFKPYHGKLLPAVKEATQQEWSAGEVPVVCATIAFGMGINKPDVRFVIHFTIAKSLEGYLQESGRAGRDGQDAHCLLYYRYNDVVRTKKLIEQGNEDLIQRGGTPEDAERQKRVNLESLSVMSAFCQELCRCRREMLLEHFGEKFSSQQCRWTCDNCRRMKNAQAIVQDVTPAAEILINILRNVSGLTATSLRTVFRGLTDKSAAGKQAMQKGMSGAGRSLELNNSQVETIIRRMVTLNLIQEILETHQGRATIARLAVNEQMLAEVTAGGQRPLKVEITTIEPSKGSGKGTGSAVINNNGAGTSAAAATAAAAAPAGKKAVKKRATGATAAAPAPVAVINLVSDDEEDDSDDETAHAKSPDAKIRFEIMSAMLRQLSLVLKEHIEGKKIPLSTTVQEKIARNPPSTLEDIEKMTISGFNTLMKARFGPALLAGVAQADAHFLAVKADAATVEDFVLDKVTVLNGLAPGKAANTAAAGAGRGGNGQNRPGGGGPSAPGVQQQQYYYPQPQKKSTGAANANTNTGSLSKRPRDEDLDWGDDSDEDNDAYLLTARPAAQPAALAPYQQQHQQQQQQRQLNQGATYNAPQMPAGAAAGAINAAVPKTIAAMRPLHGDYSTNTNTIKNINTNAAAANEMVPLVQRQKQLKAKLQQAVASHATNPAKVSSMALDDINNAFG